MYFSVPNLQIAVPFTSTKFVLPRNREVAVCCLAHEFVELGLAVLALLPHATVCPLDPSEDLDAGVAAGRRVSLGASFSSPPRSAWV